MEKWIQHKLTIGIDQNINKDKYSFGLCHAKVVTLFFCSEQQRLMLTIFVNLVLKYLQILIRGISDLEIDTEYFH